MQPARQRLDPDDAPAGQLEDGLIVDAQVALLERSPQVGLHLQAPGDTLMHGRLEDLEARLAVGLGLVHRDVGVAEQVFSGVAVDLVGHADADLRADQGALDVAADAQGRGDALAHVSDLARVGDVLQQDGELVAAEACGGVAGAELLGQPPSHRPAAARRPPRGRGRR